MISKEEVHILINAITSAVLKQEFASACARLKDIYDQHLRGQSETEQVKILSRLIEIIRELKGYSGKAAALLGINIAEQIPYAAANKDLVMLLLIGRTIFNSQGDPHKLRAILYAAFEEQKVVQDLKPAGLRSTLG